MTLARPFILALIALLIVATTPASAQDGPVDPARIVGTFQGQALSGGEAVEVVTVFAVDSNDDLVGTYSFRQGGEWFDGTLTKARLSEQGDVTFIWQDAFGAGTLTIMFADDYQSFAGAWSSLEDTTDAFPWTGKRTK
ncbi:MAG: hypothetical protein AAF563_08350 [Pseudomonadota bacterium]